MSTSTAVSTVAAILVTLFCVVSSQAPAGSPMGMSAGGPSVFGPVAGGPSGSNCMTLFLNMTDCLGYVSEGSKDRVPDKNCCPELAGLVDSNPICLCQLLAGGASSYGIVLDISRALALPGICKVETPPVSTCAVLGYPVMAPMAPISSPSFSPGVHPPALAASPESGKGANGAAGIGKPPPASSVVFAAAILFITLFF